MKFKNGGDEEMKPLKKIISFLLLLLLFPIIGGLKTVIADETEDQVQVTLHKLLFKEGNLPEITPNDGKNNPFGSLNSELMKFTGLNEVTFAVYDVTEAYYQLKKEGLTTMEAQSQLVNTEKGSKLAEATTKTIAGEDGIAIFSLPKKDALGNFKAYRFVETNAPAEYVAQAGISAPFVLILPIIKDNNQELTDLHLYPKNEQIPYEDPVLKKEVATDHKDFELGATIPYEITTPIPLDVWSYQSYRLEDKGNEALHFKEDSLKVTVEEKDFENEKDYTLEATKQGFVLGFKPEKLKAYAGKELKVSYTMTLVKAEKAAVENEVTLYPGNHEEIKAKTTIYTGGKQFLKVHRKKQDETLAGAKFVLRNDQGKYLLQKDEKNHWETITGDVVRAAKNLTVFTSDEKGLFAVQGLAYGAYELVEIVAPKGFILSKEAVTFNVDEKSFPQADLAPLKVVNEPKTNPVAAKPTTSPSKGKTQGSLSGKLPKTGEKIITGASYLGLVFMLLALGIYTKKQIEKRKKNEKQLEK